MAPLAGKYDVAFCAHVDSNVPLVLGDYEKTTRMLENLVSNAVKFTPDGGCVDLSVSFDTGARTVTMAVSDTGIGIAAEDQERIFERFFQVDSSATRIYSGSGLGLALVREYAVAQGYTVAVESVLGEGSAFTVRIPAAAVVELDEDE